MKVFIYTLVITRMLHFGAAHLSTCFRGSSRTVQNYLHFVAGIGGYATIALFILACFVTTWWVPIATFAATIFLNALVPKSAMVEFICSLLFPIAFIASAVLIALNL